MVDESATVGPPSLHAALLKLSRCRCWSAGEAWALTVPMSTISEDQGFWPKRLWIWAPLPSPLQKTTRFRTNFCFVCFFLLFQLRQEIDIELLERGRGGAGALVFLFLKRMRRNQTLCRLLGCRPPAADRRS